MDLIDKSSDAEQLFRNAEINNHINQSPITRSRDTCIDCDEPIPSERLNISGHIVRCIDCQNIYEHKKKQGQL